MKRTIAALFALLLVLPLTTCGKGKDKYVIGFYNVENLFDTTHDEGKNDYEFLPDGLNKWNEGKYKAKLHNIATAIRSMQYENGQWHSILGLAEVENLAAVEALVSQPELQDAGYKVVFRDGPDRRGIDCALLYRPEDFKLMQIKAIPFTFDSDIDFALSKEEQEDFRTRDILMVTGKLGGEMFAVFVAHLPSRGGGKGGDLRCRGAEIIYEESMHLMAKYPDIKIVCMGDMNDNPSDDCMSEYLHGEGSLEAVGEDDFFNPFVSMHEAGYGSEEYRGEWNIFDQILVNSNLVGSGTGGLRIQKITDGKYYGRVFNPPFLVQQGGDYEGTPFRTFSHGVFIHGYSDHYPTFIVVSR